METFGRRLRKRAQDLKLSDAEVARRIEIGERRYANYVSNDREPAFDLIPKICSVLETHPDYLFGITDDPSPSPATGQAAVDRATLARIIEMVSTTVRDYRLAPSPKDFAVIAAEIYEALTHDGSESVGDYLLSEGHIMRTLRLVTSRGGEGLDIDAERRPVDEDPPSPKPSRSRSKAGT